MCDTPSNSVSWPEKRFEKKEIKDARDASSAGLRALLTLNEVGPCLRTVVANDQFKRCPSLFCDDTQLDDDDDDDDDNNDDLGDAKDEVLFPCRC